MNKESFLKKLEQKLKVLSKEEIKDILNEYEDIIDEKVKHGKTEEEAVKEFGDIASLSREILKSYKINPEYQKSDNDFLGDCEDLIKKGAKKLTEVTEDVVNTFKKSENEITLEIVFEIILKVILILLVIAFMHIPFWIIGEIGESFFGSDFMFFGNFTIFNHSIFGILWKAITEIAYIIVCILLVVAVFKKYTVSTSDKKEEVVKESKKKVESKIEEKKEKTVKVCKSEKKTNSNTLGKLLVIIVKVWISILFLFPLVMIQFGILIALCVAIYFLVKSVDIYAILILLVGVSLFVGHLIHILFVALFTKRKIHFWPFVPSFLMIVLGGIFTVDYFLSFSYSDNLEEAGYKLSKETYEYILEDSVDLNYDEIVIDNSLEDQKIMIEITYYDQLIDIEKEESIRKYCEDDNCINRKTLRFYASYEENRSVNSILNDTLLQNIKDKKVVNYSELIDLNIRVIANSNTVDKIY